MDQPLIVVSIGTALRLVLYASLVVTLIVLMLLGGARPEPGAAPASSETTSTNESY